MAGLRKTRAPGAQGNKILYLKSVTPQYGTYIMSPTWCLEFVVGSQIFWKISATMKYGIANKQHTQNLYMNHEFSTKSKVKQH